MFGVDFWVEMFCKLLSDEWSWFWKDLYNSLKNTKKSRPQCCQSGVGVCIVCDEFDTSKNLPRFHILLMEEIRNNHLRCKKKPGSSWDKLPISTGDLFHQQHQPQNLDGENYGKAYLNWMIWGENPYFRKHPNQLFKRACFFKYLEVDFSTGWASEPRRKIEISTRTKSKKKQLGWLESSLYILYVYIICVLNYVILDEGVRDFLSFK